MFWDWAARMARRNVVLVSEATLPHKRYIDSHQGYVAGRHNDRQEYLVRVKAA